MIKEYDLEYRKVSTSMRRGATHVADPDWDGRTLCGIRWWFTCDLGKDMYCKKCQHILFRRKQK